MLTLIMRSRSILFVLLFGLGAQWVLAAPKLTIRRVAIGFSAPVGMANAGDGSNRLFVVEQRGTIRILSNGTVSTTAFLDVSSLVTFGGERGLLSVAFHPRYEENGFFYINYTDRAGDTVVARYQVSQDPNRADIGTRQVLLTIPQPFANHNGGQLQFGPDGYLYIGMGDGGSGGDPGNRAQNLGELLGKILRIDVDGPFPYGIPPDNPFATSSTTRREIWSYGWRNPWRFSFDAETGAMLIGDVGQGSYEEIDFEPPGVAGRNYGWRRMEGSHCFNPSIGCNDGSLVLPIAEYGHDVGCSVTGGYVYRGASTGLKGVYLYGDFCSGILFGIRQQADGTWRELSRLSTGLAISTFGEDEAREVYLADYRNGGIYLIEDAGNRRRAVRR